MAKATFSPAQKAKAIRLLQEGWKAQDVVDKIGCSLASLQNWRKEFKEGKISLGSQHNNEEEAKQPTRSTQPVGSKETSEEFVKRYWKHKSVDTVMTMPETIDEVVKLVNDALEYVYADIN